MQKIIKSILQGKSFDIKAEGSSMFPILHSGDVASYEKIAFQKVKTNDLILINKNNRLFTHRVIYKTGNYLITKGDNNLEADGKIYPHQIIAKVEKVKRGMAVFNPEDLYLFQSTHYFKEIVEIKKEFEKQSVHFVFLKGLPLHLYFEKTYPRRIYADCDVLIHKDHFIRAKKILLGQNYQEVNNDLHNKREKTVELSFGKKINGFWVVFDLHFEPAFLMTQLGNLNVLYPKHLLEGFTEQIFLQKQIVTIQGETFPILSNPHLIMYLTLHFFHHNFSGTFRLEFLDKVIRKTHFARWGQIVLEIIQFRLQNFVYPVFVLLKKYYQTTIPNSFLKLIQPKQSYGSVMTDPYIKNINIFDDEPRVGAGIRRFKNLFFLSSEPMWKKVMIIFNMQVLYAGIWVIIQKIKALSLRRQGSSL